MANEALEGFLREGAAAPPPAVVQPSPEPAAPTPPPPEARAPTPAPAPATKAPEAKPEDDDDIGLDHQGLQVPFGALEKARNARNDWKAKAAAEAARAELLAKQLEEARRPPPAPPPPAPVVQPPDFNTDPQGYIHHVQMQNQQILLNERLNMSEAMLRDKIGSEKVDEYVNDFRAFAEKDRSLWTKLYSQATPYQWMTKEIDRLRLASEIGDDPSAYRAKLLAEERAKWEAERSAAQPAVSPAANLPPSLANARSVAGRSSPAWTGEPSLEDVVHSIRTRKQRQH